MVIWVYPYLLEVLERQVVQVIILVVLEQVMEEHFQRSLLRFYHQQFLLQ